MTRYTIFVHVGFPYIHVEVDYCCGSCVRYFFDTFSTIGIQSEFKLTTADVLRQWGMYKLYSHLWSLRTIFDLHKTDSGWSITLKPKSIHSLHIHTTAKMIECLVLHLFDLWGQTTARLSTAASILHEKISIQDLCSNNSTKICALVRPFWYIQIIIIIIEFCTAKLCHFTHTTAQGSPCPACLSACSRWTVRG